MVDCCCSLCVDCCALLVVAVVWLCPVYCADWCYVSLFVAVFPVGVCRCVLPVCVARGLLFAGCCVVFVVCCSLSVVCCTIVSVGFMMLGLCCCGYGFCVCCYWSLCVAVGY